MPETPRIWTIGGWHDCPVIVGPALNGRSIEVVEKAPILTALEAASKGPRNDAWSAVEELLRVLGDFNA